MTTDPTTYALAHIRELQGYVPGLQPSGPGWVKLNTNENPYPPSPKAIEAIEAELLDAGSRLRYYPNPTSQPLRESIAQHHGLSTDQVIVGNGCDDLLNLLVRVFCDSQRLPAMLHPSYSLYKTLSGIQNAPIQRIELGRSMKWVPSELASCDANLFFLTNPNAPTGIQYPPEQVATLAEHFDGLVVIDETYAPFAQTDCTSLLATHNNIVITRSFSKAYALAGMRVGYALADARVIALLDRVRDSYNVDRLAQVAALAALEDVAYFAEVREKVLRQRTEMTAWFRAKSWDQYDSEANFLFVEPKTASGQTGKAVAHSLFTFLESQHVLVRYFRSDDFTGSYIRISVGSASENQRLYAVIEQWMA